jgi:hypothetical protein
MPTSLFFTTGLELKVTADLKDLEAPLRDGDAIALQRFAGYRGTEPAAAEPLIVRMSEVAYAQAIAAASA